MSLLQKFKSCQLGNTAIIFSLAIVPLLLATGAGIDVLRANNAQTALQAAVDAAAFAGGASERPNQDEVKAIAESYLAANGASEAIDSVDKVTITGEGATGDFTVTIRGKLKTSFMKLAGIRNMDIEASATVQRGTGGITEVAMVLDTTGSMEGSKIDSLKTAAHSLTTKLLASAKPGKVRIGVVPFAKYVTLGMSYRDEPWMDVPADTSTTGTYCWNDYPNRSGCYIETSTCYSGGEDGGPSVPYSCSGETCTDWGDPVQHCSEDTDTDEWEGVVGSRDQSLWASIGSPATPYPGPLDEDGPRELLPLTSDSDAIHGVIDDLYADGLTYIPSGLLWGWNLLTSEAPFTEAMPKEDPEAKAGKKVLVLMTDGANTVIADEDEGDHDGLYGDPSDVPDALTAELCTNIKADGILVYTVLFDVTDADVETMLRNCASQPSMAFVADDSAELLASFNKIGKSLTQFRLKK